MAGFPQLTEEDFGDLTNSLTGLIERSEASVAMLVEKAGYLVHQCGKLEEDGMVSYDALATLTAQSFAALEVVAANLQEPNFSSVYQQGDRLSLLVLNIDENCLLQIIFRAELSVGAVKYYANSTIVEVADILVRAANRDESEGIDFADLNVSSADEIFQRKKG